MNTEATATRLATKLTDLTRSGKLEWKVAGYLPPLAQNLEVTFESQINDKVVLIGEAAIYRSSINSYGFSLLENAEAVFDVFAEGVPAEPTDEQRQMWHALKDLFYAARDSARGTKQKVEQFEQLLEKLA